MTISATTYDGVVAAQMLNRQSAQFNRLCALALFCLLALISPHHPLELVGLSFHWFVVPAMLSGFAFGVNGIVIVAFVGLGGLYLASGNLPQPGLWIALLQALVATVAARRVPDMLATAGLWIIMWPIVAQFDGHQVAQAGFSGGLSIVAVAAWTYVKNRVPGLTRIENYRNPLSYALLATNLSIAVAIASIVVFGLYLSTMDSARRAEVNTLDQTADLVAEALSQFIEEHGNAIALAGKQLELGQSNEQNVNFLISTLRQHYPAFDSLVVAGSRSGILAHSGYKLLDGISRTSPAVNRSAWVSPGSSDRYQVSRGFRRASGHQPQFAISRRYRSGEEFRVIEGVIPVDYLGNVVSPIYSPGLTIVVEDQMRNVVFAMGVTRRILYPSPRAINVDLLRQERTISDTGWRFIVTSNNQHVLAADEASHQTLQIVVVAIMITILIVIRQSQKINRYMEGLGNHIVQKQTSASAEIVEERRLQPDAPDEFHDLFKKINSIGQVTGSPRERQDDQKSVRTTHLENAPHAGTFRIQLNDPALCYLLARELEAVGLRNVDSAETPDLVFVPSGGTAVDARVACLTVDTTGQKHADVTLPTSGPDLLNAIARAINDHPILDRHFLDEMRTIRPADADQVFVRIARQGVDEMRTCIDRPETIDLPQLHRLKGKFASLGAQQLAWVLSEAEHKISNGPLDANDVHRLRMALELFVLGPLNDLSKPP